MATIATIVNQTIRPDLVFVSGTNTTAFTEANGYNMFTITFDADILDANVNNDITFELSNGLNKHSYKTNVPYLVSEGYAVDTGVNGLGGGGTSVFNFAINLKYLVGPDNFEGTNCGLRVAYINGAGAIVNVVIYAVGALSFPSKPKDNRFKTLLVPTNTANSFHLGIFMDRDYINTPEDFGNLGLNIDIDIAGSIVQPGGPTNIAVTHTIFDIGPFAPNNANTAVINGNDIGFNDNKNYLFVGYVGDITHISVFRPVGGQVMAQIQNTTLNDTDTVNLDVYLYSITGTAIIRNAEQNLLKLNLTDLPTPTIKTISFNGTSFILTKETPTGNMNGFLSTDVEIKYFNGIVEVKQQLTSVNGSVDSFDITPYNRFLQIIGETSWDTVFSKNLAEIIFTFNASNKTLTVSFPPRSRSLLGGSRTLLLENEQDTGNKKRELIEEEKNKSWSSMGLKHIKRNKIKLFNMNF